ncbi:MAG: glycosyltransferase [Chloroflexales bacterium]|nr:glycosyltransferase [Chloroflexales bacterium]
MALLSVIVPTYNRLPRLKQVLAALERQEYPRDQFNVVVVSDGSTDGTDEYLKSLDTALDLVFIAQANQGPAAARNQGIRRASGDYVLFIDDDIIASPQLIAEHMRLHAKEANLVVLGPMLTPDDFAMSPWVAWEQAMLYKQYAAMVGGEWAPTARQFYTGNTSLARQHLITTGGFDERFRRAEDVELAYRLDKLGVRFVFNPQARGYHYAERSFRSWLGTPYAYGRNDVVFAREHGRAILKTTREEFRERNLLTQLLVRICVDHPALSRGMEGLIKELADRFPGPLRTRIARACYSAIFNLRYYQGMADELGGRKHFFTDQEVQDLTGSQRITSEL